MALIFFASSSEELALVRFVTAPVVPFPILFEEVFSDCAFVIPTVVPIIMTDDNTRIHRKFFIIRRIGNKLFNPSSLCQPKTSINSTVV